MSAVRRFVQFSSPDTYQALPACKPPQMVSRLVTSQPHVVPVVSCTGWAGAGTVAEESQGNGTCAHTKCTTTVL